VFFPRSHAPRGTQVGTLRVKTILPRFSAKGTGYLKGQTAMAIDITETVVETDAEFAARFERLAVKLKEDTAHSSKMRARIEHPAFREIVAMGERAVPLILARLEGGQGGFLWLALPEITGANPPIPEGHQGNEVVAPDMVGFDIKGMKAAWIAWGREQGYGRNDAV
jgi:hypothetical protein